MKNETEEKTIPSELQEKPKTSFWQKPKFPLYLAFVCVLLFAGLSSASIILQKSNTETGSSEINDTMYEDYIGKINACLESTYSEMPVAEDPHEQQKDPDYTIKLKSRIFLPQENTQEAMGCFEQLPPEQNYYAFIQFKKNLSKEERIFIESSLGTIESYLRSHTYLFRVQKLPKTNQLEQLNQLIRWIGVIRPEDKIEPGFFEKGPGEWAKNPDGTYRVKITFFETVPQQRARALIGRHQGIIEEEFKFSHKYYVSIPREAITSLIEIHEVQYIGFSPPQPITHTDVSSHPDQQQDCPRLSSELFQLTQVDDPLAFAEQRGIRVRNSKVQVVIELVSEEEERDFLENFQAEIETQYKSLVQAFVPLDQLCELAKMDAVLAIRRPMEPRPGEEMITCSNDFDCPEKMRCENSICVDVGCLEEGQTNPITAVSPEGFEERKHMAVDCCEGLSMLVAANQFDEDCNRIQPLVGVQGGRTVCSNCGNGICEEWESICNCPEDCK